MCTYKYVVFFKFNISYTLRQYLIIQCLLVWFFNMRWIQNLPLKNVLKYLSVFLWPQNANIMTSSLAIDIVYLNHCNIHYSRTYNFAVCSNGLIGCFRFIVSFKVFSSLYNCCWSFQSKFCENLKEGFVYTIPNLKLKLCNITMVHGK